MSRKRPRSAQLDHRAFFFELAMAVPEFRSVLESEYDKEDYVMLQHLIMYDFAQFVLEKYRASVRRGAGADAARDCVGRAPLPPAPP